MDRIALSPALLGKLTKNGYIEGYTKESNRMSVFLESEKNKVETSTVTNRDGEELDALVFPDEMFDRVLEACGKSTGSDKVMVNDMVWLRK